jgi:Ca2+-dependent lipid-binding protein
MAQLRVTVIEGKNLTKKDLFSESDSYVQIYLNDQKPGYKTKVKRNSQNPQWNQRFILYEILSFNRIKFFNYLVII